MDKAMSGQVNSAAAELYEQFYLPALFDQWPSRLIELAELKVGDCVLDVACGTGVLARAARVRVGPAGTVYGLDVNPGMLAVAARAEPSVHWLHGRAESLPLLDHSIDRVFCQFGLMFFTDREEALGEMARVARAGGSVCVATWAGLGETPGYAAMIDLLDQVCGPDAARALAAPFSIGTPATLQEALSPVFGRVVVHRVDGVARFPSIDAWVTTDVLAWTLRDILDDEQLDELRARAPERLGKFSDAAGLVRFPAPALVAVVQPR